MKGKEKCEFLRNIRKNIAELNGLDYEPHECNFEGDCPGFCPLCDNEAQLLMSHLQEKEASGSPIQIDMESLRALDRMSNMPYEDIDDCEVETGDIVSVVGEMADTDPDDNMILTPGLPALPDELDTDDYVPRSPIPPKAPEPPLAAPDYKDAMKVCKGCMRCDTIVIEDGKAIRCACLTEYWYPRVIRNGSCSLKR